MTTRTLFLALCDLADALKAEGERLRFSPLKFALVSICARVDALIDRLIDEGIHEDEDAPPRRESEDPRRGSTE